MLEIKVGDGRLGLRPEYGGAIAYWMQRDLPIFYPVTDSRLIAQEGQGIAAYPLVPFSNRIAKGQFTFEGKNYQLRANFSGENNAIHGNGWERSWSLELLEETSAVFVLEHNPPIDSKEQWPFCYQARIRYKLCGDGLAISMSVKNTDVCNQPVGMGFHPYIARQQFIELGFTAQSVWNNGADHLPEGRMRIDGRWVFNRMRPLNECFLDNCYAGWDRALFIKWPYDGMGLTVTASSVFNHLVIFTPEHQPYFTAEPVTNMNNAINMPEISDRGLKILKPGETLEGNILYSLSSI